MIKIRALILAAGYATRLYPLTRDMPKALLSIADKPMVEYILDKIEKVSGVDEILIITNDFFYDHFQRWLKSFKPKKPLRVINDKTISNEDRLGALGDIKFVLDHEKIEGGLMVIAGDNLFEYSLVEFLKLYEKKKSSILALYDMKDKIKLAKKFGVVITDKSNKVIDFEEKPPKPKTSLAATACYVFTDDDLKELLKYLNKNPNADNPGEFIAYLSKKKDVYGFVFDEGWYDIGSFDQLEEAYKRYENKGIQLEMSKVK